MHKNKTVKLIIVQPAWPSLPQRNQYERGSDRGQSSSQSSNGKTVSTSQSGWVRGRVHREGKLRRQRNRLE
ncbi:hypothetical protein MTR_2g086440 [Medicago truncatula]|uniref:Uncharacterized protein n=1 Tax=Medicago truncatula TaxID=3880 RepID=G7ITS8_MEDTR|nr:hypothetical protein MTR_2g086440 [Medicago truncatula]